METYAPSPAKIQGDQGAPIFLESLEFAKLRLDGSEDKKKLIHAKETESSVSQDALLSKCGTSYWDFDRIVHYLAREKGELLEARKGRRSAPMLDYIRQELERLWLQTDTGSDGLFRSDRHGR